MLDVAHNAEGIQQVLMQVELIEPAHLHIVIGMVKDKDIEKVLALLVVHEPSKIKQKDGTTCVVPSFCKA